ncbi:MULTISPECIES: biofilm formation/cell division transcriptional regulator BrpA [Streptococcus]|jgi:transcriptional regulator|uniref:Cell envelope-like function transcriptional attenuator common domain protein n=2 Tax=Streptococcus TaxID=1301 RepID=E7SD68_9STRE|nr:MULTISPECIES: LCP family protein [Streptococcus]EFV98544.1 cell envelope-like function transcriptional attenuator common domain protein [Streptococcus australis ATCC 700641]EGU61995.1 biofilm regulatory protein A [Streptococcus australis ATCC 700641]MCE3592581.1 LCP family protein [Streptococcus sp. XMC]SQH65818.1 transcriptional regulator [Streptococcus australis]
MIKKILLMFFSLLAVTTIGLGAYGLTILNQSTNTLSKTFKGIGDENNVIAENKPMTILLMGVDTGSGSREDQWVGNSDTMILVTVNPQTRETTIMSLERDILTNITKDGETVQAKLNAAYAQGGAELAIETIQDLMNIHIDRYAMINMKGLVQLVDKVGGITVNNPFDFDISIEENEPEYTAKIPPGRQEIDGEQALVYSRMRYQDPEGDYGRQKRQREVIEKIIKKVLTLDGLSNYQGIIEAVSDNMQTNISLDTNSLMQLMGYRDALKNIRMEQLKGEDATLADGGSYQIVTSEHLLKMQNILRKSLGLSPLSKLKTSAVLLDGDETGGASSSESGESPVEASQDTGGGYYDPSYAPETSVSSEAVTPYQPTVTPYTDTTVAGAGGN